MAGITSIAGTGAAVGGASAAGSSVWPAFSTGTDPAAAITAGIAFVSSRGTAAVGSAGLGWGGGDRNSSSWSSSSRRFTANSWPG
ncbi:MAG: hypothetical protein KJ666_19080 [Bacteroidetes bacterium]|nr:hypothetical protein [Bacteroidota bacterium]